MLTIVILIFSHKFLETIAHFEFRRIAINQDTTSVIFYI
jgi:hypothetical protein